MPKFGEHKAETLFENEEATIAHIVISGLNHRTINHASTTMYRGIGGRGRMVIGDVIYTLRQGDVVVAPAGVPYHDQSDPGKTLDMIAVSEPPFDAASVETIW